MTTEADLKEDISRAGWREQLWRDREAEAKRNIAAAQADRARAEQALADRKKVKA